MRYQWPHGTEFHPIDLEPEETNCDLCNGSLVICDHRFHSFFTFYGPTRIKSKLKKCSNPFCKNHHKTLSSKEELLITQPWWLMGWDVFAWIGHRRFSRHWSIKQIEMELQDSYQITLSHDTIGLAAKRYQTILSAREQDPVILRKEYRHEKDVILMIDGLQPEKGHETLYVVREFNQKRVWFAEALLSSSNQEIQALLHRIHDWVKVIGKPVRLWISDKQQAFVAGIAKEFPGVPHRYCESHFLRALAKPILEADSHAKVELRKKVRGLRTVEKEIRDHQKTASEASEVGNITLEYCSAVRGILNDDQGGPLHPPGIRMAEGLNAVKASLDRNLRAKKGALKKVS